MIRRQRMNVYFEPGLLKQGEALTEHRKVSTSAVIKAAVLSPVSGEDDGRRTDDVDEAVALLREAFVLYVRSRITHQLSFLANENEVAKDRGAEMYARFNEVLVRRLAKGQRFLNEGVHRVAGRKRENDM